MSLFLFNLFMFLVLFVLFFLLLAKIAFPEIDGVARFREIHSNIDFGGKRPIGERYALFLARKRAGRCIKHLELGNISLILSTVLFFAQGFQSKKSIESIEGIEGIESIIDAFSQPNYLLYTQVMIVLYFFLKVYSAYCDLRRFGSN